MSVMKHRDPNDKTKWVTVSGGGGGTPGAPGKDYVLTDTDKQEIAGMVQADSLPEFICDEAERVAKNVQAARTAHTLVFPVLSDFHLYAGNSAHDASMRSAKYAGIGIRELGKHIGLDGVVLLGDYSWMDGDGYDAEQVKADIVACKKALGLDGLQIWCVGNHDLNYGKGRDRLLTQDELYAYIGANSGGVKPYDQMERGYGYLDFETQKIRIIYLNTCDGSDWAAEDGKEAQASWISPTQIQWLADTALDFSGKDEPALWGIVIVSHHPLHYATGCFGHAMTILEAYRDGRQGSLSCTIRTEKAADGTTSYPQQSVTYDFSSAERAEIICNIHGHNHNCGMSKISSTSWYTNIPENVTPVDPWLWRLCIPNICVGRENEAATNSTAGFPEKYGEFHENGNPMYWEKEADSAKATSFCVVSIDRKSRKIYAHIFGAGKSRVVSYAEDYTPSEYPITVHATNCSPKSDNDTCIAEGGAAYLGFEANEGYNLPDTVTVIGADYAWGRGLMILTNPTGPVTVQVDALEKKDEYPLSVVTNHCSTSNPDVIANGQTLTLFFVTEDGYSFPSDVSVSGATYFWYPETGKMVLSSPMMPVTVTVTAVQDEASVNYTNQLPIATDMDGSVYNGAGYKTDTYLSDGNPSSRSGSVTTGFIPVPDLATDYLGGKVVIYFRNTELAITTDTRLAYYTADKTYLGQQSATNWGILGAEGHDNRPGYTLGSDGYLQELDISDTCWYYKLSSQVAPAFVRICGKGIDADTIITVNEPIT